MTNNQTTKLDRFKVVLDAYGARQENWPESERIALSALLHSSDSAQKIYSDAEELDQFLTKHTTNLTAPSSLLGAILQDASSELQIAHRRTLRDWFPVLLKPASGLMLAACFGALIGFSSPNVLVSLDDVNLDELSVSDTVLDWELDNGNT